MKKKIILFDKSLKIQKKNSGAYKEFRRKAKTQ